MDLKDWLSVIETIILAITAAVVAWSTYETYRIRKETSRQVTIMGEELLILRSQLAKEEEQERSLLRANFNTFGSSLTTEGGELKLYNNGASIYNVSVEAEPPFMLNSTAQTAVSAGGPLTIAGKWAPAPKPERIVLRVRYQDKEHRMHSMTLVCPLGRGSQIHQTFDT